MQQKHAILVTRPQHQAEMLCHLLRQQGYNAVRFPTLKIVAGDDKYIKQQLKTIQHYHWLIFVSVNAVNFTLRANDGKIEAFQNKAIAAVGKATAKAIQIAGLSVSLTPKTLFNSEGLLATEQMKLIKGKSCLIVRGKGGRETLANTLRERGAKVDYMEVYTRERPDNNSLDMTETLQQEVLDAITITSGDALKNLLLMVNDKLHDKIKSIPLIVISSRLEKMAKNFGFKHIAVAEKPDDAAIIKAVTKMCPTNTQQYS